MKEKEKKDGKAAESIRGVPLSDNDKSLLQRWIRMMDNCTDRSQPITDSINGKKDSQVHPLCAETAGQIQPLLGKGLQLVESDSGQRNNGAGEHQLQSKGPQHQMVPKTNHTLSTFYQPRGSPAIPLPFPVMQVPVGRMDMLSTHVGIDGLGSCTAVKNSSVRHQVDFRGGNTYDTMENWPGPDRPATGPSLPQHQLLPLGVFLNKIHIPSGGEELHVEVNGDVSMATQANGKLPPNLSSTRPRSMEKVHASLSNHSQSPPSGSSALPRPIHESTTPEHPVGGSIPDIHTVTLQLSKSQVGSQRFISPHLSSF